MVDDHGVIMRPFKIVMVDDHSVIILVMKTDPILDLYKPIQIMIVPRI
jgi:hypothetical protein